MSTPLEPEAGAPVEAQAGGHPHVEAHPTGRRLAKLTLIALGVVYGDIGTSPLYAIRECFKAEYGLAATETNVYGVLSLILWSLISVVSIKYIVFVMRADNRGEGGILSLVALILQRTHREADRRRKGVIIALGLIGAALLYGDGIITPAISVLGATEGLEVVNPVIGKFAVPLTLLIIFALFFFQKRGTAGMGKIFGPVTFVWFVTIGLLGAAEIFREPRILLALNPWYAVMFFVHHGTHAFVVLGAVVLAVTGAEALYADMGHFGKRPIRLAWFALVLPALVLNYFGQGGLILHDPQAAANPFYLLAPRVLLYPLIALATMAAIIASQAMISGAFSLTRQCVQLGYSPRVTIIHTSKMEHGQIYIPEVNNALMIGCLLVVLSFRSSTALGAAYGIAVTGTFLMSTSLLFIVARTWWGWTAAKAALLTVPFFIIDGAFFGANVLKIQDGGWVPITLGLVIFTLMTTWNRGRLIVQDLLKRGMLPIDMLIADIEARKTVRVPGVAVFMTREPEGAPVVLLHHLKHNKVLHEKVVLLSILSEEVPEVPDAERISVKVLPQGLYRITARYGFMESTNVPAIMERARESGLEAKPLDTSYYLGREQLLASGTTKLARWRKKLYVFMSKNSRSATAFYGIPPNRVVELGAQLEF
ncbi:MAG TPA: potassium transporter Kup [Gemmatimonadaceae bacterium]|nr:potassium transporter Kup [Gemmatimonadaceae bacterium]